MELKELIQIFKKNYILFWLIVGFFLLAGLFWRSLDATGYRVDLNLNITRQGQQQTSDYTYDDFYRLQADERFSDTVVRWLGSARTLEEIRQRSQTVSSLALEARRLSSQYIEINYWARDFNSAKKISQAINEEVNQEISVLNKFQKEDNWFVAITDDPIILKNEWPLDRTLIFSFMAGIFFGFWGVLITHYLKEINHRT
jgi:hypothetical protein